MLIKFDADDALVDSLKIQYGQKVASKAFMAAAEDAPKLSAEVRCLKRDVQDRDREIAVLRQTLERARSAAAILLEACGQGDLLDDPVPKSPAGSARPAPIGDPAGTISPLPGERMVDFVNRLSASKAPQ
ncbi:hypothetical protein [Phytopseudomonas flavescens]|nr:hypothetical protein [Pseudomonas flavescens]